jgi:hypothetical protein
MLGIRTVLAAALVCAAGRSLAAESEAAGTWSGESRCAVRGTACRDETVVYSIQDVPGRSDAVFIKADKIVDGKPVTMGTGEWQYDRTRHTLEWRLPRQVWLLEISGARIEGTLTMADGTVIRRMSLRKD